MPPKLIIIMGVSGSGKSAVGMRLASRLGCDFIEGDAFHPQANIEKMSRGVPLTDEDREPWLSALHRVLVEVLQKGECAVVACSALKKTYRERLLRGLEKSAGLVFLDGEFELIFKRMASRTGHFMPPELLQSQLRALEPPEPHEAVILDIRRDVEQLVAALVKQFS